MTEEEKLIKILDIYFNREDPPKFINVSRVPLICQDISTIKTSLETMQKSIDKREDDHENRLRKVEKNQSYIAGIGATIGAFGGWFIQKLLK